MQLPTPIIFSLNSYSHSFYSACVFLLALTASQCELISQNYNWPLRQALIFFSFPRTHSHSHQVGIIFGTIIRQWNQYMKILYIKLR
jgi:hypothetical protein